MWSRVDIVQTNVSEERVASIYKVEEKSLRARNQREKVDATDFLFFFYP
jgi:hypothetical protein